MKILPPALAFLPLLSAACTEPPEVSAPAPPEGAPAAGRQSATLEPSYTGPARWSLFVGLDVNGIGLARRTYHQAVADAVEALPQSVGVPIHGVVWAGHRYPYEAEAAPPIFHCTANEVRPTFRDLSGKLTRPEACMVARYWNTRVAAAPLGMLSKAFEPADDPWIEPFLAPEGPVDLVLFTTHQDLSGPTWIQRSRQALEAFRRRRAPHPVRVHIWAPPADRGADCEPVYFTASANIHAFAHEVGATLHDVCEPVDLERLAVEALTELGEPEDTILRHWGRLELPEPARLDGLRATFVTDTRDLEGHFVADLDALGTAPARCFPCVPFSLDPDGSALRARAQDLAQVRHIDVTFTPLD